MLARVLSAALVGIEAALVSVEVDVASGLPVHTTVGLPDSAVRESRERVRTAIRNAGYDCPNARITVNLAPADLRKEGASFDLPIALGILTATDCVQSKLAGQVALGALDPNAVDEARFAGALETAKLPPVDLLIRTGGERRISNFLLWDTAYSELFFSDVLWPAFDAAELDRAFAFYAQRQRRFGRTGEQIEAASC